MQCVRSFGLIVEIEEESNKSRFQEEKYGLKNL